jgi:hypothetical protein
MSKTFRDRTTGSKFKEGSTVLHQSSDLTTGLHRSGAGVTVYVDMRGGMTRLSKAFEVFGAEVAKRALYNAINAAGMGLRTAIIRDVVQQTSLPRSRVASAIVANRAHPNRLQYRLEATDIATKVSDFGKLKAGQQNPSVKIWGRTVTYKKAFVVKMGNGDLIVAKRVAKHQGSKWSKKGPLGVKQLWGPIVPKEMIRPGSRSLQTLSEVLPRRLMPMLQHEFEQAVIRAKAASGT